MALCSKHSFDQFPWLESIDRLLLGLRKGFYYSGKSSHIFKSIKAAVTRWLSHGAVCKCCQGRYHIIIEALDDIITTSSNPELAARRDTLSEIATVYQITFLEDVLSVTNILSLLLQSDKKDFSAISRSINTVLGTLKVMRENRETKYLKNFSNTDEIIQNIENYQIQNIVSSRIRKRQKQDHNLSKGDFHTTVFKPFIHALTEQMKGAFNISNLPVLNAFLKLDPQGLSDRD